MTNLIVTVFSGFFDAAFDFRPSGFRSRGTFFSPAAFLSLRGVFLPFGGDFTEASLNSGSA